jgi:cytochrome c biogenesis protein CcmG, thiol:disulfide interchange protein DsbE
VTGRIRLVAQIAAVAVVAALLGLLGWKLTQDGSEVTAQLDKGGSPAAPTFTLERLDGKGDLDLASLRGKAVVLNFWASWCVPCKEEAPEIEKLWRQFRSRGVVVVGVDSKDATEDARSFMRRYGITYPVVHDGGGNLWGPYGVTGVPETRLISRTGKFAPTQFAGAVKAADLRAGIEQALRT